MYSDLDCPFGLRITIIFIYGWLNFSGFQAEAKSAVVCMCTIFYRYCDLGNVVLFVYFVIFVFDTFVRTKYNR